MRENMGTDDRDVTVFLVHPRRRQTVKYSKKYHLNLSFFAVFLSDPAALLLKGALCDFGQEIQTQTFNIYNVN